VLIAAGIAFVATLALVTSLGWDERARLFPQTIAIALLVLAVAEGISSARASRAPRGDDGPATQEMAPKATPEVAPEIATRREAVFVAWLLVFLVAIWLIGFELGFALGTVAYLRITAREGWRATVLLAAATFGAVWALENVLHVSFAPGLLLDLPR
jgi:hypothetical protein